MALARQQVMAQDDIDRLAPPLHTQTHDTRCSAAG
jgi:hypothetical protein